MVGDILQPTHLVFVLVIALLVLGPKRLPEVGRSLGKGIRDFKGAIGGEDHEGPQTLATQGTTPQGPAAETPVAAAPAEPAADSVDQHRAS